MLFVQQAQIERVLAEKHRYPFNEMWFRLRGNVEAHLSETPDTMFGIVAARNLFQWDKVLTDLSVFDALVDDGRYLDHALTLTDSLADSGWRRARFTGHIHVPWMIGVLARLLDMHRTRMTDEQAAVLLGTIADMAQYVTDEVAVQKWGKKDRIPWNHPVIGYTSLGLAGLVVDDDARAGAWLDEGLECSVRFLDIGLSPSGMTWEGVGYCGFVFRQIGTFLHGLEAIGRLDEVVPAGGEAERRLHRVPIWYANELLPRGGALQSFNNSKRDPHEALWGFLSTFAPYEPRICAAVWELLVGRSGLATYGNQFARSSLSEAVLSFPSEPIDVQVLEDLPTEFCDHVVGFVSARDRWGPTASVFAFNAGPMQVRRHDHSDNTSFTLVLEGNEVVLDGGPASKRREGLNSSSWGHNLVFIDGMAQLPAGEGVGVSGEIVSTHHDDHFTAVLGDATASYGLDEFNPVRHAHRHAVFVTSPFPHLLVYDDVDKDGDEHLYECSLHLPRAEVRDAAGRTVLDVTDADHVPVGAVHVVSPSPTTAHSIPWTGTTPHELWMIGVRSTRAGFAVLFTPPTVELRTADVQDDGGTVRVVVGFDDLLEEFVFRRWTGSGPAEPPAVRRR